MGVVCQNEAIVLYTQISETEACLVFSYPSDVMKLLR